MLLFIQYTSKSCDRAKNVSIQTLTEIQRVPGTPKNYTPLSKNHKINRTMNSRTSIDIISTNLYIEIYISYYERVEMNWIFG